MQNRPCHHTTAHPLHSLVALPGTLTTPLSCGSPWHTYYSTLLRFFLRRPLGDRFLARTTSTSWTPNCRVVVNVIKRDDVPGFNAVDAPERGGHHVACRMRRVVWLRLRASMCTGNVCDGAQSRWVDARRSHTCTTPSVLPQATYDPANHNQAATKTRGASHR